MDTLSYKTKSAKPAEVDRKWFVVDADGEVVGRIATKIATVLRGKHKASFTPHVDTGDYVIIVNAAKARFTGNKLEDKVYLSYSGYPGGQKSRSAKEMFEKKPIAVLENAVRGMVPKNALGRSSSVLKFVKETTLEKKTSKVKIV